MAERHRVLVTDFLGETTVESHVLSDIALVETAGAHDESDLADRVADADVLIAFHDISLMTDATFSRAGRCVGVIRAGVGFNNVDLDAASARGIVVCNVPDYGSEEVADHTIMLLLAVARRLIPSDAAIRAGGWDYQVTAGAPRLRGRTIGLVGCGRIGTATALRAKAFGLDVVFYDPYARPGYDKALGVRRVDRLEALLEQSDIVSLHCYLDAASFHLIDRRAFGLMRPGSILVNTARGPVVDQEALIEALDSGHLLGAGLDVVEREPLDDDRLRQHPRVVLTPHSAFYSVEGFEELRRKAAEEARRFLLGETLRCPVNLDRIRERRRLVPTTP
jgi:phosphoglycerate dehydrogenase-like enzyme